MTSTPIHIYIQSLEKELAAGNTTEHSHRPALKTLFQALNPVITATNEREYCFVAYQAVYGKSGIKNFIVNEDGKIYSADCGFEGICAETLGSAAGHTQKRNCRTGRGHCTDSVDRRVCLCKEGCAHRRKNDCQRRL